MAALRQCDRRVSLVGQESVGIIQTLRSIFKICVRAALYDQSNWRCLQSTGIWHLYSIWHVDCETKYYS